MQIALLNICRINIRIHCFMCAPQEAYNLVIWVVPDPKKPSRTADGTLRFYVGAPPTDAEGQRMHYQCFSSLLWGAKLQHDSLHTKRAEALHNKAQVEHTQRVLEHGIQPDQEDCDELGPSFRALVGEQTLKKRGRRERRCSLGVAMEAIACAASARTPGHDGRHKHVHGKTEDAESLPRYADQRVRLAEELHSLHDARGISAGQSPSPTAIDLRRRCRGCVQQWRRA
jgi:hypothetical protein